MQKVSDYLFFVKKENSISQQLSELTTKVLERENMMFVPYYIEQLRKSAQRPNTVFGVFLPDSGADTVHPLVAHVNLWDGLSENTISVEMTISEMEVFILALINKADSNSKESGYRSITGQEILDIYNEQKGD